MNLLNIVFVFTVTVLVTGSHALRTVPAGKLPQPLASTAAVYDYNGSVYIFGGLAIHNNSNAVLRYNISAGTIETVGSFPHGTVYGGAAHIEITGRMFYIGGITIDDGFGTDSPIIYRITARDPTPVAVAHLPTGISGHCTVYAPLTGVFVMGGSNLTDYEPRIFLYNSIANETVSMEPLTPILRVFAPCVGYGDSSYIFGGWNSFDSPQYFNTILRSNPNSEQIETLNTTLSTPLYSASAVLVDDDVFLVGGQTGELGVPHYLSRFDLLTEEIVEFRPEGMPLGLIDASSVYVPSLRRIYVFGGYAYNGMQDDIFYIQLE